MAVWCNEASGTLVQIKKSYLMMAAARVQRIISSDIAEKYERVLEKLDSMIISSSVCADYVQMTKTKYASGGKVVVCL